MSILGKIFNRNKKPEFDIEKAVGEYLLKLPRCDENVAIVSPKYGETHYTCEIVVAAKDLLPWAEHHADAVWSLNQEERAARKALPIWLRGAASTENSTSYVPHSMSKVLRPYVLDFVNEESAQFYCFECQSIVTEVSMEKRDKKKGCDWSWWTDIWTCPKGHQLYYQEHELHFHRKR